MATKPAVLQGSAAGVYLPEGRHPIIPFFHYSIIPVVSEANLSSLYRNFHFAAGRQTRHHPETNDNQHKRFAQHRGSARRAVSSIFPFSFLRFSLKHLLPLPPLPGGHYSLRRLAFEVQQLMVPYKAQRRSFLEFLTLLWHNRHLLHR